MSKEKLNIPETWKWVTLDDIGIVVNGGTPSTKESEFWEGDIAWVTPSDLSNYEETYISKGRRNISKIGLQYSSAILLTKNSIIFSSRAPIGYVAITKNELATNQGFKNIILSELISSKYVYYYLKTVKELAENMASGTTFLELSTSKFKQIPFPLAPIEEQWKIVEKIEELFSELDSISNILKELNRKIKVYWYSELRSFLKGDRTRSNTESVENVLIKIKELRLEKKIKYNGESDNTSNINIKIPKNWKLVKLSDVFINPTNSISDGPFGSNLKSADFQSSGFPVLKIQNIDRNKFISKNISYISKEKLDELQKHQFNSGDIIITKLGSPLGKACIVPKSFQVGVIVADLIRIKSSEFINSKFLMYSLNSSYIISQIEKLSKGTTRQRVTLSDIRNLSLIFPSIQEQEDIVNKIEVLDDELQNLGSFITRTILEVDALKQKILNDAYSGDLVFNIKNDSSSKKYLSNIKIEKEKYINILKEKNKLIPKAKKMKTDLEIEDILKAKDEPITSFLLWQESKYKDNIEEFYKKLKELDPKIKEFKEGHLSFIELIK